MGSLLLARRRQQQQRRRRLVHPSSKDWLPFKIIATALLVILIDNGYSSSLAFTTTISSSSSIITRKEFIKKNSNHHHHLLQFQTRDTTTTTNNSNRGCYTSLCSLKEWHDAANNNKEEEEEERKDVYLLPFPSTESLLLGETLSLQLKDGRHIDLIDNVVTANNSILGMVLMDQDGFLPYMPLVEVVYWEVKSGFRGRIYVDVTLQCVGFLRLVRLIELKPLCFGSCVEVTLDHDYNDKDDGMITAKQLASEIENMIQNIKNIHNNNEKNSLAEIQATTQSLSKATSFETLQQTYQKTYNHVLQQISKHTPNENNKNKDEYSKVTATSWAALSCAITTNYRSKMYQPDTFHQIIAPPASTATTSNKTRKKKRQEETMNNNLVQRLQLGRKFILEQKIYGFRQEQQQDEIYNYENEALLSTPSLLFPKDNDDDDDDITNNVSSFE